MNTFRRPMFRGGKVDSRGTGITSGLSYAKGGRVGLQFGGSPFGAPIPPGSALNPPTSRTYSRPIGPPRGGLSGGTLGSRLLSRSMNLPFIGKAMRPLFGGLGGGATLATGGAGLFGLGALGGYGIGKTADFVTRATDTPEAYAFRKEATRANPFLFDETAIPGMTDPTTGEYIPGEFEEFSETLRKKDQGEKLGFFPRGGAEKRLEEMGLTGTYDPKSGERLENPLGDKKEEKALTPDQIENIRLRKLIEDMTKVESKAKDTDMEESIDIDKEKFAKALGRDKARGQDISDMLLSFSSKALAPDATVKSAFAEFAADEVKRPSRVRKIDDSAAALAINKYIKGEISKAEAENLIKRLELQSKLTADRSKLSLGQAYARSKSTGFANRVKDAALEVLGEDSPAPKFEVVKSKDMIPVEEGGNFKFTAEDIGVIYIEEDTRQSYTFNSDGKKIPFINA